MNRLAAGISLEKNMLVDSVLEQRHQLSDAGYFILREWLDQRNSRQIALKASGGTTRGQILDLLLDLSRHYILETGRVPRRFVIGRLWQLPWAAALILLSQLPVLIVVGFTFAMIGLGLGYPFVITMVFTMAGLWAMLLLHEFGHAVPLILRGYQVVILREKVRIRLLYSRAAQSSLVMVASGLGPVLAAIVGVGCALMAAGHTNPTVAWVLFITSVLGVWQLVSLLPMFEDGKTIKHIRSNA